MGSIGLHKLCFSFLIFLKSSTVFADPFKQLPTEPTNSTFACASCNWLIPNLHATGLLLTLRISASLMWGPAYDPTTVDKNAGHFKEAFTRPPEFDPRQSFFEWDHDPWLINLIGHGLMGSEIYLRYRQWHHSSLVSLLMTTAWSVTWEYLIESWHKRPSGIDLIWTPIGGILLGEGRYYLYKKVSTMRAGVGRHILFYVLDPLGQLERDLFRLPY